VCNQAVVKLIKVYSITSGLPVHVCTGVANDAGDVDR